MTIQSHPRLVSRRCHQIPAGLPFALFPQGIFPIGTETPTVNVCGEVLRHHGHQVRSQTSAVFVNWIG